MSIIKKFRLPISIALSLLLFLFLYHHSIGYFFFQDDFFEINISKARNVKEFVDFFKFRDDIIAYRPISLQTYFFTSSSFFGLNPIGFRLISFGFLIFSYFLIIQICKMIFNKYEIGVMSASLWILSSVHFMTLSWIAAAYNIIGTFFWLSTSLIFLMYIKHKKFILYPLSLVLYLTTIGSYEFSVTWPAIFFVYYFFVLKNSILKSLKLFAPFAIFAGVYLLARLIFIKVPQITEYSVAFNMESVKAFFWYVLWTFNIPEEFKKQIITALIIFNEKFVVEYWLLIAKSFFAAAAIIVLGLIVPIVKAIRIHDQDIVTYAIFLISWFAIGISPVLLLPNHTFSMYLTLASIGIYILISYLSIRYLNSKIIASIFIVWIFSSVTTLSFYRINSWIIEAQRFTKEFKIAIKQAYPAIPSDSIMFYNPNDHRHEHALQGSHAIRTLYQDQSLLIYYNREDLLKSRNTGKPIFVYKF